MTEVAFRSSRLSLDIEAGAPILIVPHSWNSNDILVMDMGKLSVHNSFMLAQSEGTIEGPPRPSRSAKIDPMTQGIYGSLDGDLRSPPNMLINDGPKMERTISWSKNVDPETHRCLLDVMKIDLVEMDLFSAEWKRENYDLPNSIIFSDYSICRKVCTFLLTLHLVIAFLQKRLLYSL